MADVYAPGASDIDINKLFQEFGYTPTDAEANALAGAFGGANNAATKAAGKNAIAQYVNYMNQIKQFEANDPLTALQTRMNNIIDQNAKSVAGLSDQLQGVLKSAPQLFGNLTPDQITDYLKPLTTSFNQQIAKVQGAAAATGTAGSSSQAAALAEVQKQFQDTVLSTGLNIGMTSQKNQADALQAQINNLFGQTNTAMSITGQAAGQQSAQKLGSSQLIASLPSFLSSQARETGAFDAAATKGSSFQDTFNQVTGDISQAMNAFQTLAMVPSQFKTAPGGNPSTPGTFMPTGGTNPMTPSAASTSMGGANYVPPDLNLPGASEFAATGSMFA